MSVACLTAWATVIKEVLKSDALFAYISYEHVSSECTSYMKNAIHSHMILNIYKIKRLKWAKRWERDREGQRKRQREKKLESNFTNIQYAE